MLTHANTHALTDADADIYSFFLVNVSKVNGELSDSLAEKEEGSADTPEDAQSAQECSLEAKHVNHNGTAEEEMMEHEGESESQEAPVEKVFCFVSNLYAF